MFFKLPVDQNYWIAMEIWLWLALAMYCLRKRSYKCEL